MPSLLGRCFTFISKLFSNCPTCSKNNVVSSEEDNICDDSGSNIVNNTALLQSDAQENEFETNEVAHSAQQDIPIKPPGSPIYNKKIQNLLYFENFRHIPLYPLVDEVLDNKVIYKEKNKILGAYKSSEQYLDIQFRLLREDFVNPLRQSIKTYLESRNSGFEENQSDMNIYSNVKFLGFERTLNSAGMRISFAMNKKLRELDWEESKRFMTGSLLCFTHDNFQNVFFSTVLFTRVKDLEKGELVISVPVGNFMSQEVYVRKFVMVESKAFFQPYYHVMKTLQSMSSYNFPMEKYIVKVQTDDIQPPQYFQNNFDKLAKIIDQYQNQANIRNMNKSQREAYNAALTQEFSIIQGPPGTGKTYLSLQIARTLLAFHNYFQKYEESAPILIVCYTNHALDQFLEGLLPFTKDIIRVGGRSKSNALADFNLVFRRKHCLTTKDWNSLKNKKLILTHVLKEMKPLENSIKMIEQKNGILSLKSLSMVMNQGSRFGNSDEIFLNWLITDRNDSQASLLCSERHIGNLLRKKSPINKKSEKFHSLENLFDNEHVGNQEGLETLNDYLSNISPSISFSLNFENEEIEGKSKNRSLNNIYTETHKKSFYSEAELYYLRLLKSQMSKAFSCNENIITQIQQAGHNVWQLSNNERWSLYFLWTSMLKGHLQKQLTALLRQLTKVSEECDLAMKELNIRVLKTGSIVGMTTTGAAKLQPELELLQSKIVIVEEAAEVMESHIVASLTKHCQHLILVGDHKQLRPITADYSLAQKYNFDVSLFERMVLNKMACSTLNVQHRMRPEIAKLITPSIYPELYNHRSVLNFEDISGVSKNVFFITHNTPETQMGASKVNEHEAVFLFTFCLYLLSKGYSQSEITILATYRAQVDLIKSMTDKVEATDEVRVTSVDGFQGEENDIILLSLVRNNDDGNIGFLQTDNRACVALSRARKGLFIMGNMDILSRRSETWQLIKKALEEQHAIGNKLFLKCTINPQHLNYYVQNEKDIIRYMKKGGCSLPCGTRLRCGHTCQQPCHSADRKHGGKYRCQVKSCRQYY